MADADGIAPIIIKKVKKGGHDGHHGGAWKVAYADFVTAMMAFFLLMWLLGSSTKAQLEGISEYFQTPLKVALQGGYGSGDSSSVIKGGGEDLTRKAGQVKRGETEPTKDIISLEKAKAEHEQETVRLQDMKANLGFDNRADLARLQGKKHLIQFRHRQIARREPAQVSIGNRVILTGQGLEIGAG